jgi:hypothetical protein
MAQPQTLAGALFATMINAALIAVQGPRMTQDAASMKTVMDSVDALQVQLDKWFAVSAGMEMSEADKAAMSKRPGAPIPPAPGEKTRVTQSGIIVAAESDIPHDARPGNVSVKDRAINPPNKVRKSVPGDPFNDKFYAQGEVPDNSEAMALMDRVAREALGAQGDE